jgi:hypothetical protein
LRWLLLGEADLGRRPIPYLGGSLLVQISFSAGGFLQSSPRLRGRAAVRDALAAATFAGIRPPDGQFTFERLVLPAVTYVSSFKQPDSVWSSMSLPFAAACQRRTHFAFSRSPRLLAARLASALFKLL